MHIGVDTRLAYHQPAGISKYTLNLLQAFEQRKLAASAAATSASEEFAATDADAALTQSRFTLFQHRRHKTPLIQHADFQRATLYAPVHTRLEQLMLPLELLRFPVDLLHQPDFIPPLRSSIPTVVTVHDLAFLRWPHFLTEDSAAYYGQIDSAVRRAQHVIVPSESTKQDLTAQLGVPSAKISVIYEAASPGFRPLPVEPTQEEMSRKYGIPRKYVLFVGTIEPRKNVDGLLRAFWHLQDRYHLADVGLVVAGGYGWLFDETMALVAELGLEESTFFLGRVPDHDLWKLYVGAHCHVHAAHYEGFGLPPLEAMACGTPTVVSNTSSLPEVVSDAALLVDPENWEEIAIAMQRLLTDADLHGEMRDKGLQRARCFSWDIAAQQTFAVYRHIIDPQTHPLPSPEANIQIGSSTLPVPPPPHASPERVAQPELE